MTDTEHKNEQEDKQALYVVLSFFAAVWFFCFFIASLITGAAHPLSSYSAIYLLTYLIGMPTTIAAFSALTVSHLLVFLKNTGTTKR
ncbi:hypothetical protein [Candidatus Pantoea formicae]|uniref:hypothetical protein n=1 Tax=Candidatus Pantoea formicae TaxID=2608355 RepID=UPI003ED92571